MGTFSVLAALAAGFFAGADAAGFGGVFALVVAVVLALAAVRVAIDGSSVMNAKRKKRAKLSLSTRARLSRAAWRARAGLMKAM